jgi:hypothetical protein
MSKTMKAEEGLVNHSQGALILDVTPARVTELVNLGLLKRYDFLGRTYVSVKEIMDRRNADVGAGRPRRGKLKSIAIAAKIVAHSDPVQFVQGGPVTGKSTTRSGRKK